MKARNQKILAIVLVGLTAAFVLTKLFRSPARETNLDVASLRVDTALISEVKLYPIVGQRKEIRLVREGNSWKAFHENISAHTENYRMNSLLSSLAELKPQRIITRRQENWNEYEVGDGTGVQVKVLNKDEVLTVFWVGKESGGNTFVRRADQPEVYAVSGSLLNTFNKKFSDWRDKSFLRLKPDSVTRIEFQYPDDSSFVAKKQLSGWSIGKAKADSVKVIQYLNKFRAWSLYEFADNFTPGGDPTFLVYFGGDRRPLAVVKVWESSADKLILTSTLQEGVYFSGDAMTVRDLLPGKRAFLPAASSN